MSEPTAPPRPVPTNGHKVQALEVDTDRISLAATEDYDLPQAKQGVLGKVWSQHKANAAARTKRRAEQNARVLAAKAEAEEVKAQSEEQAAQNSQKVWRAKADADAERATSASGKIAARAKTLALDSRVLTWLTWSAVAWGSFNVRENFAGPVVLNTHEGILPFLGSAVHAAFPSLLGTVGWVLDPLLMLPLLMVLRAAVDSTTKTMFLGSRFWQVVTGTVISVIIVGFNVFPHLDQGWAVAYYLTPPVAAILFVFLRAGLTSHYQARIEDEREVATGRAQGPVIDVMVRITEGLASGHLRINDSDGLPSVTKAQAYTGVGKATVSQAMDALRAIKRADTTSDQH